MSLQMLSHRHRETVVHFQRSFRWKDDLGGGYGFDCYQEGRPIDPMKADRIAACEADPRLEDRGVVSYTSQVTHHAVGRCDCGRLVTLHNCMTNECDCGRFYNGSGQELAPPSQWGEETGERFDDHGNYIGGGES